MKRAGVFPMCALAAIAGCHGDSARAPPGAPVMRTPAARAVKHGPTREELTAGMVEAAAPGSAQAPVLLKFELLQKPLVGRDFEIGIALLPQVAAREATLRMSGSDGLAVAAGDVQIDIPSVEPVEAYRHHVKVALSKAGVQFLSVNVTLMHDDVTESKTFSIPVIVASR